MAKQRTETHTTDETTPSFYTTNWYECTVDPGHIHGSMPEAMLCELEAKVGRLTAIVESWTEVLHIADGITIGASAPEPLQQAATKRSARNITVGLACSKHPQHGFYDCPECVPKSGGQGMPTQQLSAIGEHDHEEIYDQIDSKRFCHPTTQPPE